VTQVRGSRTGRPIMAALDLLGRRWTLRVLWELRDGRPASFRELRERCDSMSTSVLNQRLAELRAAGLVEAGEGGYRLTPHGSELRAALAPLDAWAKRWAGKSVG
jgi:DNA-binding HxlR family transcriptional regulator